MAIVAGVVVAVVVAGAGTSAGAGIGNVILSQLVARFMVHWFMLVHKRQKEVNMPLNV